MAQWGWSGPHPVCKEGILHTHSRYLTLHVSVFVLNTETLQFRNPRSFSCGTLTYVEGTAKQPMQSSVALPHVVCCSKPMILLCCAVRMLCSMCRAVGLLKISAATVVTSGACSVLTGAWC